MQETTFLVNLMALFFLASVSAYGDDVKGMIVSRSGDTLMVKSGAGSTTTVVITDNNER
jgi:hypothetical protein